MSGLNGPHSQPNVHGLRLSSIRVLCADPIFRPWLLSVTFTRVLYIDCLIIYLFALDVGPIVKREEMDELVLIENSKSQSSDD